MKDHIHTDTYAVQQPAPLDLLLQEPGKRRAYMRLAPAVLLKKQGVCRTSEAILVLLAFFQSHFNSRQQSNKTPPYFSSTFNQSFIHINEHERKEIGNIFTLGKQSKRRLWEMPSINLINPGESPRLGFFFLNAVRSQKSFYMSKIKSCKPIEKMLPVGS